MTANIPFLHIISSIQKLQHLTHFEPVQYASSAGWVTSIHCISVLSVGDLPHKHPSTRLRYISPSFHSIAYPFLLPRQPWHTTWNVEYVDALLHAWAERYVLACIYSFWMRAVIYLGSGATLIASALSHMATLPWRGFVNYIRKLCFLFSFYGKRQDVTAFIHFLSTWLGVQSFPIACTSHAPTLTTYHLS